MAKQLRRNIKRFRRGADRTKNRCQVKLQEEQLHRSLDKLAERRQQLDKSRLDKNDFGITQIQFEPKVTSDG